MCKYRPKGRHFWVQIEDQLQSQFQFIFVMQYTKSQINKNFVRDALGYDHNQSIYWTQVEISSKSVLI